MPLAEITSDHFDRMTCTGQSPYLFNLQRAYQHEFLYPVWPSGPLDAPLMMSAGYHKEYVSDYRDRVVVAPRVVLADRM
jgi:hypothetical protein